MKERQFGHYVFELDLSQPIYEQVADQLRRFILRGEMASGDKVPSVRELAQALKVNPNTVMRAYQEIEADGLMEKRRGQGTFVTTDEERVTSYRSGLLEEEMALFMTRMHNYGFGRRELEAALRTLMKREMDDAE